MSGLVLVCGNAFDGISDSLTKVDFVMKDGVVFRALSSGDERT